MRAVLYLRAVAINSRTSVKCHETFCAIILSMFRMEKPTTQDLLGVRYYYEENGQTVELHFVDNKLSKRVLHFGEKAQEDADLRKMPRPGK